MLAYKLLINCYLRIQQLEKAQEILEQFVQEAFSVSTAPMTEYLIQCAVEAVESTQASQQS